MLEKFAGIGGDDADSVGLAVGWLLGSQRRKQVGHFFWGFILRNLVDRSGSCQGGPTCNTGGRDRGSYCGPLRVWGDWGEREWGENWRDLSERPCEKNKSTESTSSGRKGSEGFTRSPTAR